VECAESGAAALELLKDFRPNLILLDIYMPELTGFELIDTLKADDRYKDIPVIFLTADNSRDTEIECFRKGAVDFITKPFIPDIMISRVSRSIELDTLRKHLQSEVERQTATAERRRQQMEELLRQVIQALADTIDAKDCYTNGHSTRVAEYARKIVKAMNGSIQEQNNIYYMGLLHDIGKIGVPDEIINKPAKLTYEEFEIIKTHPNIGARILENISAFPGVSNGARWHHERYDGRGYPDGLVGTQIPLEARIIGVADAYDAMTSNRSYRNSLPQSVVREEIERGKGTQFDPEIADVMLRLIDEDTEYTMREFPDK
jgi:putative two-component system response regulator